MDDRKFLTAIIGNTFTSTDLNRRMAYLREYLEYSLFTLGKKQTITDFLKEHQVSEADSQAIIDWGGDFYKYVTAESVYSYFKNWEKLINNLPQITVYLPFSPSLEETIKLGRWIRSYIGSDTLLNIKIKSDLVGGCAFIWKGVYHQFDLHFFVKKNRAQLLQVVKDYAAKQSQK